MMHSDQGQWVDVSIYLSKNSVKTCLYCKALVLYDEMIDHYDWHRRLRAALGE